MASLDMSLDDMIKSSHKAERGRGQGRIRRGRGGSFSGGRMTEIPHRGGRRMTGVPHRGGRRMTGVPHRGGDSLRVNTTVPSAYTIAKSIHRTKSLPWQRDLFEESLRAVGLPGIENGANLFVSNLDGGVSNDDIRELFSEIGELKRYAIHYDKNGRPSGSAEVVFSRRSDAFQAMKRYNNVQLDGKPMKIEIVGGNLDIPVLARGNVVGINGRRTVVMKQGMGRGRGFAAANFISGQRSHGGMTNGRGSMTNGGRGRGSSSGRGGERGRGRGGGRGGKRNVDKSAVELDKELENYHAEAMQT